MSVKRKGREERVINERIRANCRPGTPVWQCAVSHAVPTPVVYRPAPFPLPDAVREAGTRSFLADGHYTTGCDERDIHCRLRGQC
jgi:hypothetical protein